MLYHLGIDRWYNFIPLFDNFAIESPKFVQLESSSIFIVFAAFVIHRGIYVLPKDISIFRIGSKQHWLVFKINSYETWTYNNKSHKPKEILLLSFEKDITGAVNIIMKQGTLLKKIILAFSNQSNHATKQFLSINFCLQGCSCSWKSWLTVILWKFRDY